MIAAPATVDEIEQSRARISGEAQRIYDATARDVTAEIARLDAAKRWAESEMDRITAAARADLGRGRDPDLVERQVELDIAAVVEKASAPGFDPRPSPPDPPIIPTMTPPALPVPALPPRASTVAPEPPATPPSSDAPSPTPPATQTCGCGHRPRPVVALALAALLLLARGRGRGR